MYKKEDECTSTDCTHFKTCKEWRLTNWFDKLVWCFGWLYLGAVVIGYIYSLIK